MTQRPVERFSADADFPPTIPPGLEPAPARPLALGAFRRLGLRAVRASVVDLETMTSRVSWGMDDDGTADREPANRGPDDQFASAMATILQVSATNPGQTLSRRLDPLRRAFAWRLDDRHVVVAEATYKQANVEHTEAEAASLRRLCDVGLRGERGIGAGARSGAADEPWSSVTAPAPLSSGEKRDPDTAPRRLGTPFQAGVDAPAGDRLKAGRGLAGLREVPRASLLGIVLLAVGGLAISFAANQYAGSMQDEALRLKKQADAAVVARLSKVLAGGDYGEVQAELEALAAGKHFDGAVVLNARGRVIARVGDSHGARIGEPLPVPTAPGSHALTLDNVAGGGGRAVLWGTPAATSPAAGAQRTLFVTGLAVASAAWVWGALLVLRRRRAGATADDSV